MLWYVPMHAWVIVNRRARRLAQRGPLLDEIRKPRPGIEVVETASLAELEAAVRKLRAVATMPVVVIAGGDGSYMATVTALAAAFGAHHRGPPSPAPDTPAPLPSIAFLPGGTVGTIARNWGVTGDPVRYARRLLDRLAIGKRATTPRPTLRVVEESGRARVGFICGAGLVARFFELYEAAGASGNVTAAKLVAKIFLGSFVGGRLARSVLDPAECTLRVDGQASSFDRLSLLCASVVPNLGLGMRLTYRAGRELDRFHVVATPLDPPMLGPQMPLVLAGRPLLGPNVDALATRLSLRFPKGRGAYVMDGDLFRTDELTVTAGPVLDVVDV